ncbi:hypothetical protein BDP27DRAFT_1452203 [Rhodocollybia butyracea]|uniref:F-box domain-containing protein n=1 Tax=Rhodocollybia butyracea TaxID=206335 RepID=A0A9P5PE95_9AGAR|nr:hypothetical protein BDP27DRAFT_1452203 [Rhodocollybia butyracea]
MRYIRIFLLLGLVSLVPSALSVRGPKRIGQPAIVATFIQTTGKPIIAPKGSKRPPLSLNTRNPKSAVINLVRTLASELEIATAIEVERRPVVGWQNRNGVPYTDMFRFFSIIEGFLKGNLDLSGRHETRLNELKPLWKLFFDDVFRVKDTARISLVQEEDEDGFSQNQPFYKITEEEWKDFRFKWKIPRRLDFNHVVKQTERICQLCALHQDGPKIQKLCLLDLPTEVLDLILSVASLENARLLSATSKRLYRLGRPYTFKASSAIIYLLLLY